MKPLLVHALRTEIFGAGDDLVQFVAASVPATLVREELVLLVTSKIVSLAEERLVAHASIAKQDLVRREADVFFGEIGHGCFLTVKENLLLPSAGIDESNSATGDYILFPADPFASAEKLRQALQKRWGLQRLALLITDSHTSPLRRGVTGICLSYAGFKGVRSMVGKPDLFGRELRMTQMNLADGLAAAAVLMMGEGNESRPLAVIENAPIEFSEKSDRAQLNMPLEEDLYYPLLRAFMEIK